MAIRRCGLLLTSKAGIANLEQAVDTHAIWPFVAHTDLDNARIEEPHVQRLE